METSRFEDSRKQRKSSLVPGGEYIQLVGSWKDGRMDRWVDGWMMVDGWTDGWVGGRMGGWGMDRYCLGACHPLGHSVYRKMTK